jgi:hypothetical protein
MQDISANVVAAISRLRQTMEAQPGLAANDWATIETFCAVALLVLSSTPPHRIRSAAMTVEIQNLMKRP